MSAKANSVRIGVFVIVALALFALAALVLGGAILLVSVVREKFVLRKTDKYREVIR